MCAERMAEPAEERDQAGPGPFQQLFDLDTVVSMFQTENIEDIEISSSSEEDFFDLSDPEATTVTGDCSPMASMSSSSTTPTTRQASVVCSN